MQKTDTEGKDYVVEDRTDENQAKCMNLRYHMVPRGNSEYEYVTQCAEFHPHQEEILVELWKSGKRSRTRITKYSNYPTFQAGLDLVAKGKAEKQAMSGPGKSLQDARDFTQAHRQTTVDSPSTFRKIGQQEARQAVKGAIDRDEDSIPF